MIERRAEARLWCSHLIRVRLEDADGRTLAANLEDISPSGACLQTEEPLAAGTRVCLLLGRQRFPGTVRYAVVNEVGHFAGVQFDGGRKWSREAFEPQHLTDPAEMRERKSPPAR